MRSRRLQLLNGFNRVILLLAVAVALIPQRGITAQAKAGFISLFDGKTLNGWKLVEPRDTGLENLLDRSQPIFPGGQIELQNHGDQLWFKNIYIRELQPKSLHEK
jgi:hypothetical protein